MEGWSLVTAPEREPVSLAEAKEHLRVSGTDEDNYIELLITAARIYGEKYTNRAFITQTWDYSLDYFPGIIHLKKAPLQSVTSITYIDTAGQSQTLSASNYKVDTKTIQGRITPAYGLSWPSTRGEMSAVTIRIVAGYGEPSDVPKTIKQAILVRIADMYDNRESVIKGVSATPNKTSADALLDPHKIVWIG